MKRVRFRLQTTIRGTSYQVGDIAEIDDDLVAKLNVEVLSDVPGSRAVKDVKQVRFLRPTKLDGRMHGAGAYVEIEERKAEVLRRANAVVFPGEPGWSGNVEHRLGRRRREFPRP